MSVASLLGLSGYVLVYNHVSVHVCGCFVCMRVSLPVCFTVCVHVCAIGCGVDVCRISRHRCQIVLRVEMDFGASHE